jgi:hypothetical protein
MSFVIQTTYLTRKNVLNAMVIKTGTVQAWYQLPSWLGRMLVEFHETCQKCYNMFIRTK